MKQGKSAFHVTYEIVTPESAEHADAESRGFVLADCQKIELLPEVFGPAAGAVKAACGLTLRQALDLIGPMEDSGHWFTEVGERMDYKSGAGETRAFHPPDNISGASYGRLRRLLQSQRLLVG